MRYYQLIPEKILSILPEIENLICPYIKGYCKDYMMEVISLVACRSRKDGSMPQLQMTHIMTLVPQGHKYLYKLMELGIIKRSGSYEPKISSYKYSFHSKIQSKYVLLPLNNMKLVRRLEIARKKTGSTSCECPEQIRFLKRVSIVDGCMEFINGNYAEGSKRYNLAISSVVRINNNDIHYNVDQTSRRFHSNITVMPKELRQFLRVNGQPLVNLDLKNSQPYFSTLLLTNPCKVADMARDPLFAEQLEDMRVPQGKDIQEYIFLVTSGQIYEFLMDEFAKEGISLTRAEAKKQLFKILYSENVLPKRKNDRKVRQIFSSRFPTVFEVFSNIKGLNKGKNKFLNYKRFAILLQSIESQLILRVILKRVYKEIPKVIALTIHDSILTTRENAEAVRKIMAEELSTFIGYAPQIRIEDETAVSMGCSTYSIYQYDCTTFATAS